MIIRNVHESPPAILRRFLCRENSSAWGTRLVSTKRIGEPSRDVGKRSGAGVE